jgi:phosphoglycolate phosphatase-like HAD superfamily hydrolase
MTADYARLHTELEKSRKEYQRALERVRTAETIYRTLDPGHPDGNPALQNANIQLGTATENFHRALREFADAVLHRVDGRRGASNPWNGSKEPGS